MRRILWITLLMTLLGTFPALAQQSKKIEYRGTLDDNTPSARYPVSLQAGEGFVAIANGTSNDLDTQLFVYDDQDEILTYNDDRGDGTYDSEVAFISDVDATYFVEIVPYENTTGNYLLTINIMSADEIQDNSRVSLSGDRLYYDTAHFRIHYTFIGEDAVTEEYVKLVADAMEEVYQLQVVEMGWRMPPADRTRGGDGRYDVYLMDLVNDLDGGILGFARPENFGRLIGNQTTNISSSFLALDNNYELEDEIPLSLMRSTAAHEFHHAIQFAYDDDESMFWYYEATATWMEAVTLPNEQDATRYVEYVYEYPEICFGAEDDADPTGLLMYGTWMFLQSLADRHGYRIINTLWENIALYEGWESLMITLEAYDDTLIDAISYYHLQNIVRDYKYIPFFKDETVWLDSRISGYGVWSHAGLGAQELGANYIQLDLPNGIYDIALQDVSNPDLRLWVMGVRGDVADVYDLGKAGTMLIKDYDYVYAMVMNTRYDDDVSACDYATYNIAVSAGTRRPLTPVYQQFAQYFAPLVEQD